MDFFTHPDYDWFVVTQLWRVFNFLFGLFVLVWLRRRIRHYKGGTNNVMRTFLNSQTALVIAAVWVSAETFLEQAVPGARSVVVTAGLIYCCVALNRARKERNEGLPTTVKLADS